MRPLLASSAIPMVFTPVEIDGNLYADGGILDNFPVEPLVDRVDVILGVLLAHPRPVDADTLDNSFAVVQRAFEVAQYVEAQRSFPRCSLVLQPDTMDRFTLFDIKKRAEIFKAGREAAEGQMGEIVRLLEG